MSNRVNTSATMLGRKEENSQKRAVPNIPGAALLLVGPDYRAVGLYYLISIFFGLIASAFFRVNLRTPSLYAASTVSASTFSGIRKLLWKDP